MTSFRWVHFLVVALAFAGPGVPAGAVPFDATLRFDVTHVLGPTFFSGSGAGSSTASGVTLPGNLFGGIETVYATSRPFEIPISRLAMRVAGNGPGEFAGSPLAGTMPLLGTALFKGNLGGGPITWIGVPLFTPHSAASAAGIGLGVGGQRVFKLGTEVYLDVFHTPWSVGAKTVTGVPYTGLYHFPTGMNASRAVITRFDNATAMYTGTDSRTPGGLGQVTLVSPTKMTFRFEGDGTASSEVMLGTLTLRFVPEPATLVLLGAGVAFLAHRGRRRAR